MAALILGEHGTGKRDLALHIHQQSKRASGPFVRADGASISAKDFADIVQRANGGTLFLANVDALDTELQPLLLEILDGEPLLRGPRAVRAHVRLIASAEPELTATTSDTALLTRLCRVSLFLPPLRERRSDVPMLIRHLLDKYASENDGPARRVPDDALVLLWQYDWPGNVRELAEVVRKSASAATDGVMRPNLLPAHIRWSFKRGTPGGGESDPPEDPHPLCIGGIDRRGPSALH
jgi:DNA-binding NtrC family response regulator